MPRKAKNREQQQQQDEHQEMDIEFDDEPQQQAARIEQIHFDFNNDEEEDLLNAQIPPRPEKMVVMQGGERLVISHIEVDNFKSYFGKQIIGPFHKVKLALKNLDL
jgi:c-di-AMP phosphodiesterase-like protein